MRDEPRTGFWLSVFIAVVLWTAFIAVGWQIDEIIHKERCPYESLCSPAL